MAKIMLVLDNMEDQNFLETILVRMRYTVIAIRQSVELSEQLIDHFPDVVFVSTLGRNARILSALGKIKKVRGKPKLVFVRQEKDAVNLSSEQKGIIDGVLFSPVDPFKLIDILASTTEVPIVELRKRYNEILAAERDGDTDDFEPSFETPKKSVQFTLGSKKDDYKVSEYGETTVFGGDKKGLQNEAPEGKDVKASQDVKQSQSFENPISQSFRTVTGESVSDVTKSVSSQSPSPLIHDEKRRKKYSEWEAKLKKAKPPNAPAAMDAQKLRAFQQKQAEEVQEAPEVVENRKHFLKTLFSINPADIKKKA